MAKAGADLQRADLPLAGPDRAVLVAKAVEIVVQVNGRARVQVRVGRETTEADVVAAAASAVDVERPTRVVYVPGGW